MVFAVLFLTAGALAIPVGAVRLTAVLGRTGHPPAAVVFMGAFSGLTAVASLCLAVGTLSQTLQGFTIFAALFLAVSCIPLSGLALWVAFKPWPMDRLAPGGVR